MSTIALPASGRRLLPALSPLSQRRLATFRRNRRGAISLVLFLAIFVASLFADVLATDRPLLVRFDGHYYVPFAQTYPETTFGGDFATEAEYRDPFVVELIQDAGGWILWAPVPFSYRTINYDLPRPAPSPPTGWFWQTPEPCELGSARLCANYLGTDDQGRDVLARIIHGIRISVLFGLGLTLVASVIGIVAGAVQGFYGGWTDLVFQRFVEVWTSLPTLFILIILASMFTPGVLSLLLVMVVFSWPALVGVVRAEFLRGRNFDYVRAARALGQSDVVVMFKHVLPNAMISTITFLPFILSGSITTLTSLDFLGFGLPPGSPSIGELLNQGKNNLQAPWLGFTGFFTLAILLSLLVFVGEAVRDAFDPRKTFQ
ncbi:MAG: ABC transporter permease [Pseudomonadota bacterium]